MFKIGEKICYPMHGVGVINAIEERTVLGKTARYYVLRFGVGKMTAMVPVETAEQVGLRSVISPGEFECILEYMKMEACAESDNWNQRYRDNYSKLRGGNIYDVADVVKCLRQRDHVKGLSAGERKMLMIARQVLLAELSTAGDCTEQEVEAMLAEEA